MRSCTDCFHYKACLRFFESSMGCGLPSDYNGGDADRCEDFVSASDVVPRAEVENLRKLAESDCEHCACELLNQRDEAQSEIERLTRICDSYAFQYGTVRDQLPIIQRIGVDAAKEIFEAIGAVMKAHSIGDIDDHTLYVYIHTLEQKYTEGKK